MCRPASFIVTKDAVLWSKTSDRHEDILQEFGIKDIALPPAFVRVELVPNDGLLWTDPDGWTFNIDQDSFPKWWSAGKAEKKVRSVALRWQAEKVVKPGEESTREKEYVYGTVQKVLSGGTVQKVLSGGTVQKVLGGGTVQEVLSGTVQEVWGGGTVQKVLSGGTVQKVLGGGTVQEVLSGTVQEVWGGTVQFYTKPDLSILQDPNAVLIDRSGEKVLCYVGKQA